MEISSSESEASWGWPHAAPLRCCVLLRPLPSPACSPARSDNRLPCIACRRRRRRSKPQAPAWQGKQGKKRRSPPPASSWRGWPSARRHSRCPRARCPACWAADGWGGGHPAHNWAGGTRIVRLRAACAAPWDHRPRLPAALPSPLDAAGRPWHSCRPAGTVATRMQSTVMVRLGSVGMFCSWLAQMAARGCLAATEVSALPCCPCALLSICTRQGPATN